MSKKKSSKIKKEKKNKYLKSMMLLWKEHKGSDAFSISYIEPNDLKDKIVKDAPKELYNNKVIIINYHTKKHSDKIRYKVYNDVIQYSYKLKKKVVTSDNKYINKYPIKYFVEEVSGGYQAIIICM